MAKRPKAPEATELTADELTVRFDESALPFKTTKELEPLDRIVGQERAMGALDFGIEIDGSGYNLFVLGPVGCGKTTAVLDALKARAATRPTPSDWCYVNNFDDPNKPLAIRLAPGQGARFRKDMEDLVQHLTERLGRAFESDRYQRERQTIGQQLQEIRSEEMRRLQDQAREKGFVIQATGDGFAIIPVMDGKALTPDQYNELPDEKKQEIDQRGTALRQAMQEGMHRLRQKEKEVRQALQDLDRGVAEFAVGHLIDEVKQTYGANEAAARFLDAVRRDVVEHFREFGPREEGHRPTIHGLPFPLPEGLDPGKRYSVNVIVDNADLKGAPVVMETNPVYNNLIGRIEHQAQFGAMVTDFTLIKPGALHRANGGYLVLEVLDVFRSPFCWEALKRCLKERRVKIEELATMLQLLSTVTLDPEPIPLDLKVVLIGQPMFYYLLYALDEDFQRLFKVKADFDVEMERTAESLAHYGRFVAARCQADGLRPFDRGAVARLAEYGSRMVEDQTKLTAEFSRIHDLVRESSYWAGTRGRDVVTADDVELAIDQKVFRANRIEERLGELIERGMILVDVDGEVVGQVNGLSVLQLGDHVFGKPTRITARTFPGRGKVVDIARETEMGGKIHSKGVLILSGYLAGRYGTARPLTLGASLSFEQTYEEVEGDSASVAELVALLSSLAGVPVRQGIAVTGSVNQHGDVQPIGGATYKIEGFFGVCRRKGLTGRQGVVIPHQNRPNLVLRKEVRDAVAKGKFHIYPVRRIEEAVAILTGLPAGERDAEGVFPPGTLGRLIDETLARYGEGLKGLEPRGADEPGSGAHDS